MNQVNNLYALSPTMHTTDTEGLGRSLNAVPATEMLMKNRSQKLKMHVKPAHEKATYMTDGK